MSKFISFYKTIERAIDTCVSATFEQREKEGETPLAVIESLVNQHILPLTGPDNSLQVPLMGDKPDWRKSATELAFRRILIRLVVKDY